MSNTSFLQFLKNNGFVTGELIDSVLSEHYSFMSEGSATLDEQAILSLLISSGTLSESVYAQALAKYEQTRFYDLTPSEVDYEKASDVSFDIISRYKIVPLSKSNNSTMLVFSSNFEHNETVWATCNYNAFEHRNEIQAKLGNNITLVISTISAISSAIDSIRKFGVENNSVSRRLIRVSEPTKEGNIEQSGTPESVLNSQSSWSIMPIGHGQAMSIISLLKLFSDGFKSDLTRVRQEWDGEKTESQRIYDSVSSSARAQYDSERQKYIAECEHDVQQTEERRATANSLLTAATNFANNVANIQPKSFKTAVEASQIGLQHTQKGYDEVIAAIGSKVQALRNLCNCLVAEAERVRNDKLDKARIEQLDRNSAAERKYKIAVSKINNDRKFAIEKQFPKDSITAYCQGVLSSRFNAQNYQCQVELPEFIMLGKIGLVIPNFTQDEKMVVQAVELQTSDVGVKDDDQYVVTVPYAQRLSDGISLLMRFTPKERDFAQGLLQTLLLKLFMSFPAGKLEATMIDPLELGASFPDIPKIAEGPNSARIIDTKIWSKEKDIENAIATLRQRLENMTQAYGNDQASRLKKEVIRALAITDFPIGFNDTALKDLHAIVRNSASLGVCVLICANDTELEKLKQKNATLVSEITQSVVETKTDGKRLMIAGPYVDRVFLEIDEMPDVIEKKDNIISMISNAIETSSGVTEDFANMFKDDIYDSNNWFTGNHDEIAVPIGIKGASTVVKLVVGRGGGSTEHHALIAGLTGAGKSTLLHTLIMSTMINYSPDEVQMYLLDFKEGVEFNAYTHYRLPSLRIIALNSEREFGLNVLKELCTELENRTKQFSRYGVSDINDYMKLDDVPKVPKLLLIFDEVQELFRSKNDSDTISSECLSCLGKLVTQGRALGIHLILACQDFHNCSGLEAYFANMAIRIPIKGSADGASSILKSDNDGIRTLQNQPAGAAIYNGGCGVESANNFFQISYLKKEDRIELLEKLDSYYSDPDIAPLYEEQKTRVLLTNAEDDINNCFNKLIIEGIDSVKKLSTTPDGYGIMLGQGFGKNSRFITELTSNSHNNLLVVTKQEKIALSLFILSAMSILYELLNSNNDKTKALIYIVDLLADDISEDDCNFDYLEEQFPQQVRIAKIRNDEIEQVIESLYNNLISRSEGATSKDNKVFLLFFGINRARKLKSSNIYEEDRDGEVSTIDMLQKILCNGPKNGIHSIVWGESVKGIEGILGDRFGALFDKRIAYDLDAEAMETLVAEEDSSMFKGKTKTAVYLDINNDIKNTHFRPYEIPAKVWIERFSEVYHSIVDNGGDNYDV